MNAIPISWFIAWLQMALSLLLKGIQPNDFSLHGEDTGGDATPDVEEEVLAVALLVEVGNCAGVEVEETNGGAC